MRKGNVKTLGEILQLYLRQEGLETPLNQVRLMNKWTEMLGPGVASYTGEIFIKNQILYVQIKSPALKHNLMMERERLVNRLNESVGSQVITRIIFR